MCRSGRPPHDPQHRPGRAAEQFRDGGGCAPLRPEPAGELLLSLAERGRPAGRPDPAGAPRRVRSARVHGSVHVPSPPRPRGWTERASRSAWRVQAEPEDPQPDATVLQLLGEGQHPGGIPAQTVEGDDGQGVSGPQESTHPAASSSVRCRARSWSRVETGHSRSVNRSWPAPCQKPPDRRRRIAMLFRHAQSADPACDWRYRQ